ncbi:ferredoxin-thioredoxin reductase catalytic chain, chloroplastic [Tanacetum coccineum]
MTVTKSLPTATTSYAVSLAVKTPPSNLRYRQLITAKAEPSDKSVEIMRKFSEQYARKSGTYFCVDKSVTSVVIKAEKKSQLRNMFCSDECESCKFSKTAKGKTIYALVLNAAFCAGVTLFLKVFALIVRVLHMLDADWKPSMGFIYEANDAVIEILGILFPGEYELQNHIAMVKLLIYKNKLEKCDRPMVITGCELLDVLVEAVRGDRISTGSESLRYQLLYKDGVSAVNCIRRMSLHNIVAEILIRDFDPRFIFRPRSEISTRSRRDLAEINCPGGDRISTGSESLRYQLLYKDGVSAGLADHKDSLGAPLCPCRHYDDKAAEATQGFWNCPCVPMRERKECHCMLFLTPENDFAGDEQVISLEEIKESTANM